MSRLKKGGAAAAALAALAVVTVGRHEGISLKAYRDPIGIPTACWGETRGIRMGMTFSRAACDAMLVRRLDEFADKMERCVPLLRTAPAPRYVAALSLTYNIGEGAFCGSSVARELNAGRIREACDAFLKWTRAGGRQLAGLVRRRHEERAMCLQGL